MSAQYPQYKVIDVNYVPTGAQVYVLQTQLAPGGPWGVPPGFQAMIVRLNLKAVANPQNYLNAYVVNAAGVWTTPAAALAAATADFNAILADRAAAAQNNALNNTIPNASVTVNADSPVLGPG